MEPTTGGAELPATQNSLLHLPFYMDSDCEELALAKKKKKILKWLLHQRRKTTERHRFFNNPSGLSQSP